MSDREWSEEFLAELVGEAVSEIREQMTSGRKKFLDMDLFSIVLPVACDAGVLIEREGSLHIFGYKQVPESHEDLWESNEPEELLEYVQDIMNGHVQKASKTQVGHYVWWAEKLIAARNEKAR